MHGFLRYRSTLATPIGCYCVMANTATHRPVTVSAISFSLIVIIVITAKTKMCFYYFILFISLLNIFLQQECKFMLSCCTVLGYVIIYASPKAVSVSFTFCLPCRSTGAPGERSGAWEEKEIILCL